MRKYKHVKETTFNQVKKLQEAGVTKVSIISKIIGYSKGTSYCLAKAQTFPEYAEIRNKFYAKKETKEQKVSGETTGTTKMQRIMALIEQLKNEVSA